MHVVVLRDCARTFRSLGFFDCSPLAAMADVTVLALATLLK